MQRGKLDQHCWADIRSLYSQGRRKKVHVFPVTLARRYLEVESSSNKGNVYQRKDVDLLHDLAGKRALRLIKRKFQQDNLLTEDIANYWWRNNQPMQKQVKTEQIFGGKELHLLVQTCPKHYL